MADAVPSEMQQGNPYVALLLRFAPVVGDPTPGYEARVILLGVIVGCIPLLATLLLVLHTITLRRKGEKLWLYKRVRRERGRLVPRASVSSLQRDVPDVAVLQQLHRRRSNTSTGHTSLRRRSNVRAGALLRLAVLSLCYCGSRPIPGVHVHLCRSLISFDQRHSSLARKLG